MLKYVQKKNIVSKASKTLDSTLMFIVRLINKAFDYVHGLCTKLARFN